MELLTEKEALMIQACIEFVLDVHKQGYAKFSGDAKIEDLENLLKKLTTNGERNA